MYEKIKKTAIDTLKIELNEASRLLERISDDFVEACLALQQCKGKVIVTGIGKSGHIGKKIAATFASTGTPAFFIHPAEALHGDLGMVDSEDLVILISNSGEATEFKLMLPLFKRKKLKTIGFTGNRSSFLADQVNFIIDTGVENEACPLGLAPTSSAVNTLMMGDALAISVMHLRDFNSTDYAFSHPGGSLGARLIFKNMDLIEQHVQPPVCYPDETLSEVIFCLSRTGYGLAVICDDDDKVLGVFTDGDLRRTLEKSTDLTVKVGELMTRTPIVTTADELAYSTLELMHSKDINAIPIVDSEERLMAVLTTHQIYKSGIN